METNELHRGRLIDHIQLVVDDLPACRTFYEAVLAVLHTPIGGAEVSYFWADELFVSSTDSIAAAGRPTGRHHLAFQAEGPEVVDAFYAAGLKAGGVDNGPREKGPTIRATMPPFSLIPQETISKRSITAKLTEAPHPLN